MSALVKIYITSLLLQASVLSRAFSYCKLGCGRSNLATFLWDLGYDNQLAVPSTSTSKVSSAFVPSGGALVKTCAFGGMHSAYGLMGGGIRSYLPTWRTRALIPMNNMWGSIHGAHAPGLRARRSSGGRSTGDKNCSSFSSAALDSGDGDARKTGTGARGRRGALGGRGSNGMEEVKPKGEGTPGAARTTKKSQRREDKNIMNVYDEDLVPFLTRRPEVALKGVGPKKAQQLARLGKGRAACGMKHGHRSRTSCVPFDDTQRVPSGAGCAGTGNAGKKRGGSDPAMRPESSAYLAEECYLQDLSCNDIHRIADLLWHLPTGMIDRRQVSRVSDLVEGETATVLLKVVSVQGGTHHSNSPTRVSCEDVDGAALDVLIFGGFAWRRSMDFTVGDTKVVSGKVTANKYTGRPVMASPDVVAPLSDLSKVMVVQPTYPLTSGLSQTQMRSVVKLALEGLSKLCFPPEWIDRELMEEKGWPSFKDALQAAHNPQEQDDLSITGASRSRLAYDELLASQLVLALRRQHAKASIRPPSSVRAGSSCVPVEEAGVAQEYGELDSSKSCGLVEEGLKKFPFELTGSQKEALDEILRDMDGSGHGGTLRMFRLLQGDVGSGKTAVAFLAMLKAAEQGSQSCLLAPTEVLTMQHLQTIRTMAEQMQRLDGRGPLRVEVLTGNTKGKARQKLLEEVGNGEVDILVATHAVLSTASTAFKDLGLAVVDEEQRFGVEQRDRLTKFAQHVLYMSATPIPRSHTLALYGDMEVSQLRELPEGASEIETTLVPIDKLAGVVDRLKDREMMDDKVFWVAPQIHKSESGTRQNMASATERYKHLLGHFGEERVLLLHSKMSSADKSRILNEFTAEANELQQPGHAGLGGLRILVSTSIIEVGVDVPQASVCVIENAEMFGLGQLHQIRGRLGRTNRGKITPGAVAKASTSGDTLEADDPSTESDASTAASTPKKRSKAHCVLLYGSDLSDNAAQRLKTLRATRDGFLIAERDLALRGPGEVLGVRQKGYLEGRFKVADLLRQGALTDHANHRARKLVNRWINAAARAEDAVDLMTLSSSETLDADDGEEITIDEGIHICARTIQQDEIGDGSRDADADADGEEDRQKEEDLKEDRAEGLGVLLALCGRATDAHQLLCVFASATSSSSLSSPSELSDEYAYEASDKGVSKSWSSGSVSDSDSALGLGAHAESEREVEFNSLSVHPAQSVASRDSLLSDAMLAAQDLSPRTDVNVGRTVAQGYNSSALRPPVPDPVELRGVSISGAWQPPVPDVYENEEDFLEKSARIAAEAGEDQEFTQIFGSFSPLPEDGGHIGQQNDFSHHRYDASVEGREVGRRIGGGEAEAEDDPVLGREPDDDRLSRFGRKKQAFNWDIEASTSSLSSTSPGASWGYRKDPTSTTMSEHMVLIDGRTADVMDDAKSTFDRRKTVRVEDAFAAEAGGARVGDGGLTGFGGVDITEGEHTVVLVDVETTGLSPQHNRMIQLAAKVMDSEDPRHMFTAFVDPEGANIPEEVRDLTGITPEVLEENNAQIFVDVWPRFLRWLTELDAADEGKGAPRAHGASNPEGSVGMSLVFAAHNAKFDFRFIMAELERGGIDSGVMGRLGGVCVVDTLRVLRDDGVWRMQPEDVGAPRKPSTFKQEGLYRHLYGEDMPDKHTAHGDVIGLERVLSAPGIKERWRSVASRRPGCQFPVPTSLAELQSASQAGSGRRPRSRSRPQRR